MAQLLRFWEILGHMDAHVSWLVTQYDGWTYLILSAIVFLENGVVLTPFLPGDSLIFICGSLAAKGALNPVILTVLLIIFATLGSFLNYAIGWFAEPYLESGRLPFIRPSYVDKTKEYFSRYGELTIGIAKFLPIVRTFAPFLAGVSKMPFWRFALYNILGSVAWILFFVVTGYYFGNIPIVKNNLVLVAMGIVMVSVLPVVVRLFRRSK